MLDVYLDSAEVHGSFDDVVVVSQTQQLHGHRLQERPCVHLHHTTVQHAQRVQQLI